MSEPETVPAWRRRQNLVLLGAVAAAALVGGVIGRGFVPASPTVGPRRPIIQLARTQALPNLADSVSRLCPSVAAIVPHGSSPAQKGQGFLISADGWIMFVAGSSTDGPLDALFGDGSRTAISDVRSDPVSGLTVARVASPTATPLALSNQSFPRIGDFGFALQSPNGSGCSAILSMIGSDFLVDGGGQAISIRLQQNGSPLAAGSPFFGADGRVIGIAEGGGDALVPAPIAAIIIDELIRNRPSPLLAYGFRAVDLTPELASRLGDIRTRGVAVAIVQPRSNVDRAGMKAGDVVAAVNGSPISSASELSRALDAVTGSAELTIIRGDQQLTMKVSRSLG